MVYSRQYNTRNSSGGRYNSGQFVAAGGPQQQQQQQQQQFQQPAQPQPNYRTVQPNNIQLTNSQPANTQQQFPKKVQEGDVEMKTEPDADAGAGDDAGSSRPPWMKIKKISKKEKRRRQNAHLRRLITPKNALMVLNEMLLHDNVTNNFTVEATETPNQYYKNKQNSFCADLTLDGVTYKGYGGNKLIARNAAAEQAIRDLIIKRMQKAVTQEVANANNANASNASANNANANNAQAAQGSADETMSASGAEEEDPLPMIQLASFALHKLFSEWEYEGHKVPQLRPPQGNMSEGDGESMSGVETGAGAVGGVVTPKPPKKPKKPKELPSNASSMHPCMLLTYMRPHLEYRELAIDGDRPQKMIFTMGVDVDGATYIGKAQNKKEARKNAARAACSALFGVTFDDQQFTETPTV